MKYKVNIEPEVSPNQLELYHRIIRELKPTLTKELDLFIPRDFVIYSMIQKDNLTFKVSVENIDYTVTLTQTGLISKTDKEGLVTVGTLFKRLIGSLKMKRVGVKYFDEKERQDFSQWRFAVWPGYRASVNLYQEHILLNVDLCFKFIREESVYDYMCRLRKDFQGDLNKIKGELVGLTVMTEYNHEMYRIDDIDFGQNTNSTFMARDGSEISYQEYYFQRYKKELQHKTQPLLMHKRTKNGSQIYLIPELCLLTGQTQDMRRNFDLQRNLNKVIKPDSRERLKKSKELIKKLEEGDRVKKIFDLWQIRIQQEPLTLEGQRINSGNIVIGKGQEFQADSSEFDRKIQSEMFDQPKIMRIGLFCDNRDKSHAETFLKVLKKCADNFNYPIDNPEVFYIHGNDFKNWQNILTEKLDNTVQAVILLLPGRKKSAPFYKQCKKFLLSHFPIPSQVVTIGTIEAGKNLHSIINKVLIQVCSKIGGTPWYIKDIVSKPTMAIGIDVFHNTVMKKKSLLAFCGTLNKHFSRYWSTTQDHMPGQEIGQSIQICVKKALIAFHQTNDMYPDRIVVYRDGGSPAQKKAMHEFEVKAFLRAFEEISKEKNMTYRPEFCFICVNKTPNAKFFLEDERGNISNPEPGTTIDNTITKGNDFYLISQKVGQGSANPTHYSILAYYIQITNEYIDKTNEIPADVMKGVQSMTYKMCYLYYNWSGAIKVPAPLQLAHRLANLVGEVWDPSFTVHPAYENLKNLYYL